MKHFVLGNVRSMSIRRVFMAELCLEHNEEEKIFQWDFNIIYKVSFVKEFKYA